MFAALSTLAQSYDPYSLTDYSTTPTTSTSLPAGFWVAYVAFIVLLVVCEWKVFVKAGKAGWAALVPIYNTVVMLQIIGRPWWWILLLLIPVVNIYFAIKVYYEFAKVFGKGVGYTLLLLFLPIIGYPMLAFGDAKYHPELAKHEG
jgi:hypothetical protein